jgi:uncharacterized membrane protein
VVDVTRTGLLWLAPAATAVVAVVSAVLLGSIDVLFERAVSERRVFPFTGEADEQGIIPGLVLVWSALATLVTLVAVALIARNRAAPRLPRDGPWSLSSHWPCSSPGRLRSWPRRSPPTR